MVRKTVSFEVNDQKRNNTPFSDFIRNASAEEKKRVYFRVLKQVAQAQGALFETGSKEGKQAG